MRTINLEDCCEILDSKRIPITASERRSGPYPYYGANGIQDYVGNYIFDDELVLLAEDGGNFNSTTKPIAYRVSGKCWVNNHAHVLKPLPVINVDYLCYSLAFYKVGNLVNGATREKLTQAAMRKMQIRICSMPEQIFIVNILTKAQHIISHCRAQMAKLDELVKARFVEMFGTYRDTVRLGDVFRTLSGGTPSVSRPEYYLNGKIPWLTSGEINQGIITRVSKFITEEGLNNSSAKWIPANSIVIAMYGATAGKVGLLKIRSTSNQAVCAVLPHENYHPNFLYYAISSQGQWMLSKVAGAAQPNLSQIIVRDMIIASPPLYEQTAFASFVEEVDKSKVVGLSIRTLLGLIQLKHLDFFR